MKGGGALKAIRANCLDCCGGSSKEVRYCAVSDCRLWRFRFGRSPKAVIRTEGANGIDLLEATNFQEGGKFNPDKQASEIEQ